MEQLNGYSLASVDLPGCGDSGQTEGFSYALKDQAHVVLRWIKGLDLTKIILVGHSMGGVIGLYLAEALGEEVKAFFSLEGNLEFQDCTFSSQAASMGLKEFETHGFEQFKNSLKKAAELGASVGLCNYYQNVERAYPKGFYLSSVSLVEESREGDLKERFEHLPTRKWYVFGERSINSRNRSFLQEKNIPYIVVPQSGHFMMDDQPHVFWELLLEATAKSKKVFSGRLPLQ
jgi:pimeloyl-ACP methyl ester carboxylesterase